MKNFYLRAVRAGVKAMRHVQLATKLVVLIGLVTAPLLYLLVNSWRDGREQIAFVLGELQGTEVLEGLTIVAVRLAEHRTVLAAAMHGDPAALHALDGARTGLRMSLTLADKEFAAAPVVRGDDVWPAVRQGVQALADLKTDGDRLAAAVEHDELARKLHDLMLVVAERSGLLYDPRAITYHQMDMLVERLPPMIEQMGRVQAMTAAVLSRGDAGTRDRASAQAALLQLNARLDQVSGRMDALRRVGDAMPSQWDDVRKQVARLSRRIDETFAGEMISGDPQDAVEQGQRTLAGMQALYDEVHEHLDHELSQRFDDLRWSLALKTGLSLAGLVGVWVLGLLIYWSITGSLRVLSRRLTRYAGGDLSASSALRGTDELAQMGGLVERMAQQMSRMVAEIRTCAVRVESAGKTVAEEGLALAKRTDEQATGLRESIGTVEQLNGRLAATADALSHLGTLADALRDTAQGSRNGMDSAMTSMSKLHEQARRVAEINGVIDDIAFQTNLVALNASVEAARVGEAGKGFSVVAVEIRNLAMRCVEAATEVRGVIEETNDQVDLAGTQIRRVSDSLNDMIDRVGLFGGRLADVSAASQEQSAGLAQVTASMATQQQLTTQNRQAVELAEAASRDLVDQSSALQASGLAVRLRQGTADEAKVLVDRAMALVAEKGWKEAAVSFNNPHAGFVDRDLYIYAFDAEGRYLVNGAEPGLVGSLLHDCPGVPLAVADGFLNAARGALAEGGGWMEYDFQRQGLSTPVAKSGYVVPFGEGAFLGCSVLRKRSEGSGTYERADAARAPSAEWEHAAA